MEKSIVFVGVNKNGATATVAFSDFSERQYKVRYTPAGRRYIKVYHTMIYDWRGKAI